MMTCHYQSWPAIVNHNPLKQEKLVQHCVDFLFPKFSSSQSIGGRLNGICILLQRTRTNKMIVKTARYYEEETRIFQGATSVHQAGERSKPAGPFTYLLFLFQELTMNKFKLTLGANVGDIPRSVTRLGVWPAKGLGDSPATQQWPGGRLILVPTGDLDKWRRPKARRTPWHKATHREARRADSHRRPKKRRDSLTKETRPGLGFKRD